MPFEEVLATLGWSASETNSGDGWWVRNKTRDLYFWMPPTSENMAWGATLALLGADGLPDNVRGSGDVRASARATCAGLTKTGQPCSRVQLANSQFCQQHGPSRVSSPKTEPNWMTTATPEELLEFHRLIGELLRAGWTQRAQEARETGVIRYGRDDTVIFSVTGADESQSSSRQARKRRYYR